MNIKPIRRIAAGISCLALGCALLLGSCGEKQYYHDDTAINNLKGEVRSIHDTNYFSMLDLDSGTDSIINFGSVDYLMDDKNRLSREDYIQYTIRKAVDGSRVDTISYIHRYNRYTYNSKGRKAETLDISRTRGEDYVLDDTISTRLVNLEGNTEMWLLETSNSFTPEKQLLATTVQYTADTRKMSFNGADHQSENQGYTLHRFDKEGRLAEYIIANEYGDVVLNDTYEYSPEGYVVKKVSRSTDFSNEEYITLYEPGDWDEKGNWRTQKEFDPEGNLRQVTHRRIEYR